MSAGTGKNSSIQTFVDLSEMLTGHENLAEKRDGERSLAESYHELIKTAFGEKRLANLLSTFEGLEGAGEYLNKAIEKQILQNEELSTVAQEIIMLWYMSAFRPPDETRDGAPQTPEQYYQGLFWPTIRAHPLGLSGGYFGYWKYPPEN